MLGLFRPSWKDKARAAVEARDAGIPGAWRLQGELPVDSTILLRCSGILSPSELSLLDLSATALAAEIANRRITAVEAATAYCKAAAIALQATNCLVELFVPEALARARALDEHLERTGKVVGPLHGVPVSIKDHIDVKDHDSPCGFLSLVGKMVAKEDAYLVKVLRSAGAVFYCKTMNPQSIMHLETANYLGATVCPRNRALTAGGSSGGEGALLGMKGSPLGVGTDIGGSVRSPAAACGVFSLKPSVGRLPYLGIQEPSDPPGSEAILGTHGPMARHEDDLETYMRLMVGSAPWLADPSVHVRPWRADFVFDCSPQRKLRIGVMRDDGVVRPVPPIKRALDAVVGVLAGCPDVEIVEFAPWKSADAWDIISKLYWAADGGAGVYAQCAASGEPVLPLTKWIIDQAGLKRKAASMPELLRLVAARDDFRLGFAHHWRASGVDLLLSPVGPTPAPRLGTAKYWNYTSFWNLVNYPAAVCPTGLAVGEQDRDCSIKPDKWWSKKEEEVWESFDAHESAGAPLCLQLVSYVGFDEEVMAGLRKIMALVRGMESR